jgi:hypothetical protein
MIFTTVRKKPVTMKAIISPSDHLSTAAKTDCRFEDWLSEMGAIAFRLAVAVLLAVIFLSLRGNT